MGFALQLGATLLTDSLIPLQILLCVHQCFVAKISESLWKWEAGLVGDSIHQRLSSRIPLPRCSSCRLARSKSMSLDFSISLRWRLQLTMLSPSSRESTVQSGQD